MLETIRRGMELRDRISAVATADIVLGRAFGARGRGVPRLEGRGAVVGVPGWAPPAGARVWELRLRRRLGRQ